MHQDAKIYVAGHRGLVGSALVRQLQARGYRNLLLRTHAELDLTDTGYATSVVCAAGYRSAEDKYADTPKARFPHEELIEHR